MALARQVRLEDKLRAVSVIEADDYLIVKSVNVQALIWMEAMHTSVPRRIKTNSHFRKQLTSSEVPQNILLYTECQSLFIPVSYWLRTYHVIVEKFYCLFCYRQSLVHKTYCFSRSQSISVK